MVAPAIAVLGRTVAMHIAQKAAAKAIEQHLAKKHETQGDSDSQGISTQRARALGSSLGTGNLAFGPTASAAMRTHALRANDPFQDQPESLMDRFKALFTSKPDPMEDINSKAEDVITSRLVAQAAMADPNASELLRQSCAASHQLACSNLASSYEKHHPVLPLEKCKQIKAISAAAQAPLELDASAAIDNATAHSSLASIDVHGARQRAGAILNKGGVQGFTLLAPGLNATPSANNPAMKHRDRETMH